MAKPGPKGSRAQSRDLALKVVEMHGDVETGKSLSQISAELNLERSSVCELLARGRKIIALEKKEAHSEEVLNGRGKQDRVDGRDI